MIPVKSTVNRTLRMSARSAARDAQQCSQRDRAQIRIEKLRRRRRLQSRTGFRITRQPRGDRAGTGDVQRASRLLSLKLTVLRILRAKRTGTILRFFAWVMGWLRNQVPMPPKIDVRIDGDIGVIVSQMPRKGRGRGRRIDIRTVRVDQRNRAVPQRHNQRQPSENGQPSSAGARL